MSGEHTDRHPAHRPTQTDPAQATSHMSADAIESQFNPRRAVPDAATYLEHGAALSSQARGRHTVRRDVRYGTGPLATLDVFPASSADAPIHVFIHGGYWRALDKSDYSYIADALVPLGFTTIIMNYDLCPNVTLPELAAQVRAGIAWICANTANLGGAANSITLSGHSAGAHLIAMLLDAEAQARDPLPLHQISGALLIGGVYELTPVLSITVNEAIRLKPEQVDAMSPMRRAVVPGVKLDVIVGGDEPAMWIDESARYAAHARQYGVACTEGVIAGHNHFSIFSLFETPLSPLARRVAALNSPTPKAG